MGSFRKSLIRLMNCLYVVYAGVRDFVSSDITTTPLFQTMEVSIMISSEYATLQKLKSLGPGAVVEVFDCDGRVWERVLWEVDGDTAYLSSADCYQRMLDGDAEARPIGFLISDLVPPHE